MATKVLVLGATGMLAKPVVRQLVADGYVVRAGCRHPRRAQRMLPAGCECVHADVQDRASIDRAMEGCEVVYLNFAQLHSQRAFDPDLEGAKLVAKRAAKHDVKRIMRISTMGLPEGVHAWWVAARKQEADEAMRASDVEHTIFQPTWFMESLPLFLVGRRILLPEAPAEMLYWLAGDDYAKQVSSAIRSELAANQTYVVQGKYPLSMKHAIIRFVASFDPSITLLRVPRFVLDAASLVNRSARYLHNVLGFTFTHATGFHAQRAFDDLGEPTMTIDDYARKIHANGDVPRK